MKRIISSFGILVLSALFKTSFCSAQFVTGLEPKYQGLHDPRCMDIMGVPLEGPDSIFIPALDNIGFKRVISEDDEPNTYYFNGDYYGIKANLVIETDDKTKLLSTALVTSGPYRTFALFDRNNRYFLLKLQRQYGNFDAKGDGSLHTMTNLGYIKISNTLHEDKSRTIRVFYLNTTPYYKDVFNMGMKGAVQEVITENPVAENGIEHFNPQGKSTGTDIIDRVYSPTGYLLSAAMLEPSGTKSQLTYEYDEENRLIKRTLVNTKENIRSVNEYSYNSDDEIKQQTQKVFDGNNECIVSITMKNNYTAHDDEGNWTTNELKLMYWEKDHQPQNINVTQTRTISYWEDD